MSKILILCNKVEKSRKSIKGLCENINYLRSESNMKYKNKPDLDLLTNKVAVNLYVFHALVKNKVSSNVKNSLIIAKKVKQLEDEKLKNHLINSEAK